MNTKSRSIDLGMIFAAAALYFFAYAAVPEFGSLFQGFGAELPLFTGLVIGSYPWFLLLPLLVIVPFVLRLNRRLKSPGSATSLRGLAVGLLVSAVIVVLVCLVAMYLPIMNMGPVV